MEKKSDLLALELHNLTVTYGRKPAVWNLDFTIPAGTLAGIIGPNGSGKTTMLKTIMGLLSPDSGHVELLGTSLEQARSSIAYVPQRSSVDWDFPVSVFDVVLMGRYSPKSLWSRTSRADKEKARRAIEKVGLTGFERRQIGQLSGGQQQRVFIARALAQECELLFLDEPFAGVDAATESSIMTILKDMVAEGKTVIVVHHDLQTVSRYFDWIVMLNTRLIASGNTADVFTAEFLDQAYGGRLQILSEVGDLLARNKHKVRE